MLIFFNATVDQVLAEEPEEVELLISNLLHASTSGAHLIIIDRKVCSWAKENLDFNGREQAQLDRLRESYTQRGTLHLSARVILEVEVGSTQLVEHAPHKYRIGHRPFLNGRYFEASRLLVEHIENDGDMLKLILSETRRRHLISSYDYLLLHGGGADIAACLRVEIPEQRVIVSVVDSDRVAPCDTSSATKRNLDREAAKQTFVGMVCETPCKEAENYIPLGILNAHSQRLCPEYAYLNELEQLVEGQSVLGPSDCFWLFFDLKRGVEAGKLGAVSIIPVADWLRQKYQLGDDGFSDIQITGFGDGILRQFLSCGEAVKDFVAFMKTAYWRTHFGDFFDLIYWYFVAEKKARSI
jgi:hypothetical protein